MSLPTKSPPPSFVSYHGGNDVHRTPNLRIDMSVTCNKVPGPGRDFFSKMTPERFLHLSGHYPPSQEDNELKEEYFRFIRSTETPSTGSPSTGSRSTGSPSTGSPDGGSDGLGCVERTADWQVLFGNGATELIDLVIRLIPSGDWKTNFVDQQYKEYSNSCRRTGRIQQQPDQMNVKITVMINPNNPSGDFLPFDEAIRFVDQYVPDDSYLIVDESMLFWQGPDWKSHSFTNHKEETDRLLRRNVRVIVIQSWTKIFNCCGLRVGSLLTNDPDLYSELKSNQPPWSLNAIAREYLLHCYRTPKYLESTWLSIRRWRAAMVSTLSQISEHLGWTFEGAEFVSWIWINTHDANLAHRITQASQSNGYPIRHGIHGYGKESHIRVAVTCPSELKEWYDVIRGCLSDTLPQSVEEKPAEEPAEGRSDPVINQHLSIDFIDLSIQESIVIDHMFVNTNQIKIHEKCVPELLNSLESYIAATGFGIAIPSIIVGILPRTAESPDPTEQYFVVDGHHRLCVLQRMGFTEIPVTVVKYQHPLIYTVPPQRLSDDPSRWDLENLSLKQKLVQTVLRGQTMSPKSTQHVVQMPTGRIPIVTLGKYMIGQPNQIFDSN